MASRPQQIADCVAKLAVGRRKSSLSQPQRVASSKSKKRCNFSLIHASMSVPLPTPKRRFAAASPSKVSPKKRASARATMFPFGSPPLAGGEQWRLQALLIHLLHRLDDGSSHGQLTWLGAVGGDSSLRARVCVSYPLACFRSAALARRHASRTGFPLTAGRSLLSAGSDIHFSLANFCTA